MSLQNVKKTGKECSFLRRYSVATCSFTKNKTLHRCLQFAMKLVVPYDETR